MFEQLKIVPAPDPRLKKASQPVTQFDERLRSLAARMFALMREAKGVGLAAPQVGENVRLIVINVTQEHRDARAYVNPFLSVLQCDEEAEESCLILPAIHVD